MVTEEKVVGSAEVQGDLWGARAKEWAEVQEPAWRPVFEAALVHAGVRPGASLLDVGCGAGGLLALARSRGADVAGLDASPDLAFIARERLPGARIAVGDMEELPFADGSFDVVTGVNAFQFAEDPVRALGEARRVCRSGGTVFVLTWGRREECELMTAMSSVMALLPRTVAKPKASLTDWASIQDPMRKAGLELSDAGGLTAELRFADLETAARACMSAGVSVQVARAVGEERVRTLVHATLPAFIRSDGSVTLANRFNWIKMRAR